MAGARSIWPRSMPVAARSMLAGLRRHWRAAVRSDRDRRWHGRCRNRARSTMPVLAGSAATVRREEAHAELEMARRVARPTSRVYARLGAAKDALATSRSRSTCAMPTPSRRPVSYCPGFRHDLRLQHLFLDDDSDERPDAHPLPEAEDRATTRLSRSARTMAPAISAIHREDFARPWTDGEFVSLLGQDTVFGFAARETGRGGAAPVGFVLARLAAGEGEILTVAVARVAPAAGARLAADGRRAARTARASAPKRCSSRSTRPMPRPSRSTGGSASSRSASVRATTRPPKAATGALVMRRDLR